METDGSLPLLIALFGLLVFSAFFSASETAFSSLNSIRLKQMAVNGKRGANRALELEERYDKLLSTVLIGNNIVNIASSSLATVLFVGWFGNLGVTLSTLTMTVLVLFFGEISPKTLAKEKPEMFAIFAAPALRVFMVVLTPLNALFAAWKRLLLQIFHIKSGQNMTEEELLAYVSEAHEDGGINEAEAGMIRQVIEFDDLEAGEILTPRVDMAAIALDDPPDGIAELFHETGFSRLPVYGNSIDDIKGMVMHKDFAYDILRKGKDLASIVKPVVFAAKQVKISKLLGQLQQKKTHMAIIIDEYGGTLGLVTIEDIVEELVGEIWDEHDEVVQTVVELPGGACRILGSADIEELLERFGLEDEFESSSVGGWVLEVLGRFPQVGDSFDYKGVHVTVTSTVRQRVLEVLVESPEPAEEKVEAEGEDR